MELLKQVLIGWVLLSVMPVVCQQSSIPKKLMPVDEAVQDLALLRVRNTLLEAAKRRDLATIRQFTDPNLRVSVHGGRHGLQALESEWKKSGSTKRFFDELATVLSLGGRFEDSGRRTFVAPYMYFGFSDATDMPGAWVATKAKVSVFSKPDESSSVLTELSYDVVRGSYTSFPQWAELYLPDGRTGFVRVTDARNAADTHAHFERSPKGWRLVGFYPGVN